jgi:hypothetical protein
LMFFNIIFFFDNARIINKSDLSLDLSHNLTHIASQIIKQHD